MPLWSVWTIFSAYSTIEIRDEIFRIVSNIIWSIYDVLYLPSTIIIISNVLRETGLTNAA
jgi:hypothetical protein